MARDSCAPCCQPQQFGRSKESFQAANLQILCDILDALGGAPTDIVRYDYEVLCDPSTGDPVLLRFGYDNDGTNITVAGFLPDGSAYGGILADLVSCSGGGGGGDGTSMVDDSAFTVGTTRFTPAGGTYRSVRDAVTDGDGGAFAMTATRALFASLETPNGDSAMDDTNDAVRVNIVAGSGGGGASAIDDSAFAIGVDSVAPMGALADETGPDSIDEGDVGLVRMSLNRNLYVQLRDFGSERSATVTAANAVKVDGSAVTQPVSIAANVPVTQVTSPWVVSGTVDITEFPAAAALSDNFANPTTTSVAAMNMLWDGSTWDRALGNSTDGMLVNLGANNDVTVTGTVAVSSVGGTVAVTQSTSPWVISGTVTTDSEFPAAALLTDNTATPTTTSVAAFGMVYDGATWDFMRGTATDGVLVNLGANNDVSVTGTVGVTQSTSPWVVSGTVDITEFPAAAALSDNFANPTTTSVAAMNMLWDGSTWDRALGNSTDGMLVNLGSNNDVTVTGTVAVSSVGGTVAVTQSTSPWVISGTVTTDSEFPAAALLADNTATPTTTSVAAFGMVYDGATWDFMRGTAADGVLVNLGANNDVTVTGTVAVSSVGGTVAVTQSTSPWVVSGTVDITEFPAAAALSDNFANPTTTSVAAMNMLWDGSTWDRALGNSTDGMLVNLGANNDVTVTGTVAVSSVGGTVAVTQSTSPWVVSGTVTTDSEFPAAALLADNTATPTTTSVAAFGMVYDGATWDFMRGTATDGVLVNLGANNDVTVTGTVDITELPAAAALTDNFANPTTTNIAAMHMVWDGSTWDRAPGTSTDGVLVNLGANNDVIQATASNLNAQVVGNVAHDSTDSGNPVGIGLRARQTNPTAVSDGDRVACIADDVGRAVVQLHHVRDLYTAPTTTTISSTTETTILAAGGAGVFHDLTFLSISNTSNTATRVDIRDATAGTIRFSQLLGPQGGWVLPLNGLGTQSSSNGNWTAQLSAAVTDVRFNVIAVKNV